MIHVDRNRIDRPAFFDSDILRTSFKNMEDFYLQREEMKMVQQRTDFFKIEIANQWGKEVLPPLRNLFHDKCAYCETKLQHESEIDLFRPRAEAMDLDGKTSSDHYWWLYFRWENQYLSCLKCSQSKLNRFPVEGKRLKYDPDERGYRRDKALLLDPCFDSPEDFLEFRDDGKVYAVLPPPEKNRKKGQSQDHGDVTIKILSLNRHDLVIQRKRLLVRLEEYLELWRIEAKRANEIALNEYRKQLYDRVQDFSPHAALARQFLARRILEIERDKRYSQLKNQIRGLHDLARKEYKIFQQRLDSRLGTPVKQKVLSPEIPEKVHQPSVEDIQVANIEHVEIRNFRAIQKLILDFNTSAKSLSSNLGAGFEEGFGDSFDSSGASLNFTGWKMLLGENGTGKSSVLQAIALLLMGEGVNEQNFITPAMVLRRGSRVGSVKLRLSDSSKVYEMKFTKTSNFKFPNGSVGLSLFIRGYGATRLLPQNSADSEHSRENQLISVDNLFDPYVPLIDPDQWLVKQKKRQFLAVARAIADLFHQGEDLFDEDGYLITREEELVTMENGKILVDGDPLELLSDGYRSILSIACDIMAGIPHDLTDMRGATGIVLLDEIGVNLHPRWKMRIVKRMRETFPGIQFIVTTHEPLCLRGLVEDETTLMLRHPRGERRIHIQETLPSPSSMRVDQLLTSSYFGMDSTIDPEIDDWFSQYYFLLGKTELSEIEKKRIKYLRDKLAYYGTLGFTRRDQIVYEIIDQSIARQRQLDPDRDKKLIQRLSDETKKQVLDIWRYVRIKQE